MRILFAGIIARYPFGGVTWCSLMYLLGPARARPRGLLHRGHRRVRLRPGAEHARDRSRPTAPRTSTTRSSRSASATAGRSSTTTAATTAGARRRCGATAPTPICSSTCRADRGSGATSTRAIPRKVVHRLRSGVHAARHREGRAVVRRVLPAVRSAVHVRGEHRHAGLAGADRRLHVAQDVAAGHARRLAHATVDAARPLHDGDDLADRELHRRRRQQGSGVREVHRSAVAHAAALRAGHQRPADAAARARLGHGGRDGRVADARGTTATSSSDRRPSSASPSTPTSRRARAGSAIAPSAIWRPAGRRSCRTPAGPRTCRPARACSRSRRPTRRSPASTRINGDYARHARRAAEIAREHFDAARVLPARCSNERPDGDEHDRSASPTSRRSPRRFRRPSRDRWSR